MCRLYDPTEGEILLNGINIKKYKYKEYMSVFSVVFQDFKLFALPLGQNVAASTEYDADKVQECLKLAGFDVHSDRMKKGLDTWLYKDCDADGVNISGGEEQKIALARALYQNAAFLILDEPTAALDPIAEAEVYSSFNEIVGDRTAVYIRPQAFFLPVLAMRLLSLTGAGSCSRAHTRNSWNRRTANTMNSGAHRQNTMRKQ